MKKVLITGANKGIGLQTAKQMAELGYYVYLGSRNKENGEKAIKTLHETGVNNIELLIIDVANPDSITLAKKALESKTEVLDVLINNAGISVIGQAQDPENVTIDTIKEVLDVNLYGAILTTQAFLPLLKKSVEPRIVNVTSDLGSLTLQSDPTWQHANIKPVAYMASKTALNSYTIALAHTLKDSNFKVNSANPGATATDLNNFRGTRTPEFAAQIIVKTATLGKEGPTGKFFSEEGTLPW